LSDFRSSTAALIAEKSRQPATRRPTKPDPI
jgi:hypothetical protein